MSKFRKIAAGGAAGGTMGGAAKPGVMPNMPDKSEFLSWLLNPKSSSSDVFNEADMKQNLQFLTALLPGWTDRYSPSAYYHALELDKNRGYGRDPEGTKHSQGAYEMMSPEIMKAVEEFKKNPAKMKDFLTQKPIDKIENMTVPESSDRYKAMREKLYPTTASSDAKFVKTSANAKVEELKKMIPNWDIKNVLTDMAKVSARKDLSNAEKQQGMANILSQYENSIAPLNQYLKKNGIQYK